MCSACSLVCLLYGLWAADMRDLQAEQASLSLPALAQIGRALGLLRTRRRQTRELLFDAGQLCFEIGQLVAEEGTKELPPADWHPEQPELSQWTSENDEV